MNDFNEKKIYILELCSESECGSWEFWSTAENKTEEECKVIVDSIVTLVNEKNIITTEGKYVKDRTYKEIPLDVVRLNGEVKRSMIPDVEPDRFYWFYATEEGKKEDLLIRSK